MFLIISSDILLYQLVCNVYLCYIIPKISIHKMVPIYISIHIYPPNPNPLQLCTFYLMFLIICSVILIICISVAILWTLDDKDLGILG